MSNEDIKQSLPSLIKETSTHKPRSINRKEELRTSMIQIIKERQDKRISIKMKNLAEKMNIKQKWQKEERESKEAKLKSSVNRLANAKKKDVNQSAEEMEKMLDEKIARAKERALKSKAYFSNLDVTVKKHQDAKEKITGEELENNKRKLHMKLAKSKKAIEKVKKDKKLRLSFNREKREKQTLRSKIQSALTLDANDICDKLVNANIKSGNDIPKAIKKKKQKEKKCGCNLYFPPNKTNSLQKLHPDEVLVKNLSKDELLQIQDDLNYYIADKEKREKVTLFAKGLSQTSFLEDLNTETIK